MKKKAFIFLFDGFSDWEISFLTPELNKNNSYELYYFSKDGHNVKSMGGMSVKPDLSLAELSISDIELLILPGGNGWENNGLNYISPLIESVNINKGLIAAICGATIILAQNGYLNKIKHTSNSLGYLKQFAPDYNGEVQYLLEDSISDKNIITANGVSPIEFARDIFTSIGLMDSSTSERWFNLFKNGVWSE